MNAEPAFEDAASLELGITGTPTDPIVRIDGEIDLSTSAQLRAGFAALIDGGARRITLDLEGVSFIDSSGLGVIVGAMRKLHDTNRGRIIVAGVQDGVRKIFEITGLGPMFGLTPR